MLDVVFSQLHSTDLNKILSKMLAAILPSLLVYFLNVPG